MTFRSIALVLGAVIAGVAAPAAAANPEDAAINAVYTGLSRARAASDVAGMSGVFPAGAILIDARPGPAIGGGSELVARLRPTAERIVADGVRIDTAYRIERRSVMGDVAVDAGYMRQSVNRPGAEPMVRHARFLVTLRRGADGRWLIIADASMPAEAAAWTGAARVEGLLYDA